MGKGTGKEMLTYALPCPQALASTSAGQGQGAIPPEYNGTEPTDQEAQTQRYAVSQPGLMTIPPEYEGTESRRYG